MPLPHALPPELCSYHILPSSSPQQQMKVPKLLPDPPTFLFRPDAACCSLQGLESGLQLPVLLRDEVSLPPMSSSLTCHRSPITQQFSATHPRMPTLPYLSKFWPFIKIQPISAWPVPLKTQPTCKAPFSNLSSHTGQPVSSQTPRLGRTMLALLPSLECRVENSVRVADVTLSTSILKMSIFKMYTYTCKYACLQGGTKVSLQLFVWKLIQ